MTHLRTRAVHAGQPPDPQSGAITTPITQSTAYNYGTLAQGAAAGRQGCRWCSGRLPRR